MFSIFFAFRFHNYVTFSEDRFQVRFLFHFKFLFHNNQKCLNFKSARIVFSIIRSWRVHILSFTLSHWSECTCSPSKCWKSFTSVRAHLFHQKYRFVKVMYHVTFTVDMMPRIATFSESTIAMGPLTFHPIVSHIFVPGLYGYII